MSHFPKLEKRRGKTISAKTRRPSLGRKGHLLPGRDWGKKGGGECLAPKLFYSFLFLFSSQFTMPLSFRFGG